MEFSLELHVEFSREPGREFTRELETELPREFLQMVVMEATDTPFGKLC